TVGTAAVRVRSEERGCAGMTGASAISARSAVGSSAADRSRQDGPTLGLMGGFDLQIGSETVRLPLHMQRLLAFLSLQGRPLHRTYVAGRLWLDGSQEHAHGCLRTTLWRIGQLAAPVLEVTSTHVALAAAVAVDTRELEAYAERVYGPRVQEAAKWLEQVDDLLPDWYDDWVLQESVRLRDELLLAFD